MTRGPNDKARHAKSNRHALLRVLVAILLIGCSSLSGPEDFGLPDPDLSLDPAALTQPTIIYACGRWFGLQPLEEKIFVDVAFLIPILDSEPIDRPSARHLTALKKHGGQVAYTFHFPVVRAWIATKDVPSLVGDPAVLSVFRVANLRRYDWFANVGYRSRTAYDAGIARYAELGGRVDYKFDIIDAIGGLLPDRSAKTLREDPTVHHVEASTPFANCESFSR